MWFVFRITIDNPVVTQTVEVMNQTEVIQSLIDTYTSNNTVKHIVAINVFLSP